MSVSFTRRKLTLLVLLTLVFVVGTWKFWSSTSPLETPVPRAVDSPPSGGVAADAGPIDAPGIEGPGSRRSGPVEVSMDDVLQLAREALDHVVAHVDGYTAIMTKQEQDRAGKLQEPSVILMKIRTRHQGGTPGEPLQAYLKFLSPPNLAGREVIWIENANDGKLLVREAGLVGSMMTAKLDPSGFLAMQGQRYPIHEIGLTNLIEKLIERGARDRNDPGVRVTLEEDYEFEGERMSLIQIQRAEPSGRDDDFSLAEVVIDPERQLVVQFRSFGWRASGSADASPPLLESYTYREITLNPVLTPLDFDTANPEYTFPQ